MMFRILAGVAMAAVCIVANGAERPVPPGTGMMAPGMGMNAGGAAKARELLERALVFPHNLGEGKLEGARDNDIHYYLGLAERALGHDDESLRHLELAAAGDEEPATALY